jgi:uncharacterized DUF497 family protein
MLFEWNEEKEILNCKKHGVSFEHAKTIWNDEAAIEYFDNIYSVDEERYIIIGKTPKGKILIVVFCERNMVIRIISARYATNKERVIYEKRIRLI